MLREKNPVTNVLELVEAKTKVNRDYIFYGFLGFLSLYLVAGWGNDFLCNFIGFLYPAFASIRAVESSPREDDTKWLMYWCCYSLFGILEYFGDLLLFWIPFYSLTKCLFLVWLMVPGKNGGTVIMYNKVIKPTFLKHQNKAEEIIEKVTKEVKDTINNKSD